MLVNMNLLAAFASVELIMSLSAAAAGGAELKLCLGSTTYETSFSKAVPIFEKATGAKVKIPIDAEKSNSVDNIKFILEGKCEGASAGVPFDVWMKNVNEKYPEINTSEFTSRVI